MRRQYAADAADAAPDPPASPSAGYPTDGDPATAVLATLLGEYWVHMVTEAICTTIERAGLPLSNDPVQFRDALLAIFPTRQDLLDAIASFVTQRDIDAAIRGLEFPDSGPALATVAEHLLLNPPADKAATPVGVRAVRDLLLDSPPGALDTLNELAAALGDDPNFAATTAAAINLRARLGGATFTGVVRGLTPPAGDSSTRFATTAWLQDFFGDASSNTVTAAGDFQWPWDTPNGIAILEGGGGGGGGGGSTPGLSNRGFAGFGGSGGMGEIALVRLTGLSKGSILSIVVGGGGGGGRPGGVVSALARGGLAGVPGGFAGGPRIVQVGRRGGGGGGSGGRTSLSVAGTLIGVALGGPGGGGGVSWSSSTGRVRAGDGAGPGDDGAAGFSPGGGDPGFDRSSTEQDGYSRPGGGAGGDRAAAGLAGEAGKAVLIPLF